MTLLAQSVAGGCALPLVLSALVLVTAPADSDSTLPLLTRHPFAWVVGWPYPLVRRLCRPNSDAELFVMVGCNVLLWAALTYACLKRRARRHSYR
jgi:hypothetical protein